MFTFHLFQPITHMPRCPCFVIVLIVGRRGIEFWAVTCVVCPVAGINRHPHDRCLVPVTIPWFQSQTSKLMRRKEEERTIIILLQFPSHKYNRQNNTLLGAFWCWVELRTSTLDKEDEVICGGIQEENHNCLVVFRTIPWLKTQMTPLHRVFLKIQKSNYIEECFILSKGFKIFQPQLWHRAFSVVEIVDDFLWGNKNILLHCSLQLNFYVSKSNLLLIFW